MSALKDFFLAQPAKSFAFSRSRMLLDEKDNAVGEIIGRVDFDYDSGVKIISFYISEILPPGRGETAALSRVEDLLSVAKAKISGEIGRAYEREDFDALAFRGRIYIYSEIDPPQDVKDRLEEQTKHKSWKLTFRSYKFMDYLQRQSAPQAFISHDSRDKASIAAPLAASLQDKNCKIWFDQYSLKVGDSLRESIEKGLRECFRCILILTPNFLQNNKWGKREYDSIFTRELIEEKRVILPVWHQVTAKDVYAYSPILADRLGARWDDGVEEVSRKLLEAIDAPNF